MNWKKLLSQILGLELPSGTDCEDPACSAGRRIWRRLRWRHGRIQLQGEWYCAPQCFEKAVHRQIHCNSRLVEMPTRPTHRIPLGLLLLSRGQVSNAQLRAGLSEQRLKGGKQIGTCLQHLGFVTELQVTAAVAAQWRCPVLSAPVVRGDCGDLVPRCLLQAFRVIPVQFVQATRVFHLAFSEGVDYTVLYALEQMLDCKTEACVISQSDMERELSSLTDQARLRDFLFENWQDPAEAARITCGYVLKLGAERVRVVRCGSYCWVRLTSGEDTANLIFYERGSKSSSHWAADISETFAG